MALAAQEALRQPTWCTLPPDKFAPLVERASRAYPENILFVYKVCASAAPLLPPYSHLGIKPPGKTACGPDCRRAESRMQL